MDILELVFPEIKHKKAALAYRQEFFDNGETEISGDGGLDVAECYEAWLEKVNKDLTYEDENHVPSTIYFAIVGEKIVGTIQIRHKLNDFLSGFGGNIGYSVVPSERRKGYAAKMLSLALGKCRNLGMTKVLVTCANDNAGSARTIIKNGGILENEVLQADGEITQRYWIDINSWRRIIC